MAATPTPVQPLTSARLLYRNSVDKLTAGQLADLRQAYLQAKAINDDRGFNYWAGVHGLPLPMYCQHHTELFLPWHRAYLYFFELALQDQVGGVTLPWWDWTSAAAHQTGVPAAYADGTIGSSPNPLYSSLIPQDARTDQQGDATPFDTTVRSPGDPSNLPTPEEIDAILDAPDFLDFSQRIEDVHDHVHIWIGGTTGEIPWAAYDPLFWAHHAMIDRLWDLWQLRHPNVGPPNELLREALPPFRLTVAQTVSVTLLGYDYAAFTTSTTSTTSAVGAASGTPPTKPPPTAPDAPGG